MKPPKIEIGFEFPRFHDGRIVNAVVVNGRKEGHRWWWTVRLTEGGGPVKNSENGWVVEYQSTTAAIRKESDNVTQYIRVDNLIPGRNPVRYAFFAPGAFVLDKYKGTLWVEVRDDSHAGVWGPATRWVRYANVEELIASSAAVAS